jgi:hypothetical protein
VIRPRLYVTDLMLVVVRLLREEMDELVVTAREAMGPVEPWDEG